MTGARLSNAGGNTPDRTDGVMSLEELSAAISEVYDRVVISEEEQERLLGQILSVDQHRSEALRRLLEPVTPQKVTLLLSFAASAQERRQAAGECGLKALRLGVIAESGCLVDCIVHPHIGVRRIMKEIIDAAGQQDSAAAEALRSVLQHRRGEPAAIELALAGLQAIGPGARASVPEVAQFVGSQSRKISLAAARVLWMLGPDAAAAAPALVACLADSDREKKHVVARALGAIGPAAHAAVPELLNLYADDDALVRSAAREAWSRITGRGSM